MSSLNILHTIVVLDTFKKENLSKDDLQDIIADGGSDFSDCIIANNYIKKLMKMKFNK